MNAEKLKNGKLTLQCESLRCAEKCDEKDGSKKTRFSIVAYTGAVMNVWYYGKVVVDLKGISFRSEKIPIIYGHDFSCGIGHSESIEVVDGELRIEGVVSRETKYAEDFVSSSRNGFPWQASIGGTPLETIELGADETRVVNGITVDSSTVIISKLEIYETSVVECGADAATSSTTKAQFCPFEETKMSQMNTTAPIVAEDKKNEPVAANVDAPQTPAETEIPSLEASILARRNAEAAEVDRIAEIRKRAGTDASPEMVAQAIREGWTPDQFELQALRAARPLAPAIHTPQVESLCAESLEIVALRASGTTLNENKYTDQQLTAADGWRDCGLTEFCELACGFPLPKYNRDRKGWLRAAFSTTNLDYVLSRTANAALLSGFEYVENDWRKIFSVGSVNDFKIHERYRLNSSFKFDKITPGGQFKHGEISDEKYQIKAETEGIMFAITRQMLKNDDLGALTQMPKEIGMGAADALNDACWTLFLAPPADATNNDFFSAAHKNYQSGATTALSINALSSARSAFSKQTKKNGTPLGIRPTILLVPPELEDQALMLTKATQFNATTSTGELSPANYNPQAGRYQVVSSGYLSNSNFTGYSDKAWYLLVDPNRLATFEVAFLDGVDKPTVEEASADFSTMGINFRGFIDFGVGAQDYRGAMKIKGAA